MEGILSLLRNTGSDIWDAIVDFTTEDGSLDLGNILPLLIAGVGQHQGWFDTDTPKVGYQGKIPDYDAVRTPVQMNFGGPTPEQIATWEDMTPEQQAYVQATSGPPTYRMPGQVGQRYFSDTQFVAPDEVPAAQAVSQQQATDFAADNIAAREANQPFYNQLGNLYSSNRAPLFAPRPEPFARGGIVNAMPNIDRVRKMMSNRVPQQGQTGLASAMEALRSGGMPQRPPMPPQAQGMPQRPPMPPQAQGMPQRPPMPQQGRGPAGFMQGPGDGLSDSIPAQIRGPQGQGQQPATLGDGEFVVPADAVSHLGNGSSNAGAGRLQEMIDRVRTARTGSPDQSQRINPNTFMPR